MAIKELVCAWVLAARAEAKSPNTVTIMLRCLGYFEDYLSSIGVPPTAGSVSPLLLRSYVVYLQQKPAFSQHPYTRTQPHPLSDQTVHGYCRALRAFFNWAVAEGYLAASPFERVRLPRLRQRIIKPYSAAEIASILGTIDTASPEGYRDLCLILLMFDTAARSAEVGGIMLRDVDFEGGSIRVLGKGNCERLLPIGSEVRRCLWRYVKLYRPVPLSPPGTTTSF